MEIPLNSGSLIETKSREGRKETGGWLTGGNASAFQALSNRSLRSAVSSPSSLTRKGQERPPGYTPFSICSSRPALKMVNCGSLLKSALVAVVMVTLAESAPTGKFKPQLKLLQDHSEPSWKEVSSLSYPFVLAEKLASCCKTVNKQEITEPITGYMVQKASRSCVPAIM